jgi:Prenyltransferase and squalene oxidase repeat
MDTYDKDGNLIPAKKRKSGIWAKVGGGSLMFAAIFHIILLVAGGYWIFQVTKEPEKKIDFLPPGGGSERGSEHQIQKKRQSQVVPTSNAKRVFAEGAKASYSIPDQGDKFGEMTSLSSLSGSAGSGGLGGSGSGLGTGKGMGAGAGMGVGAGTSKLFELIPETMRKRCSKEDRLLRLQENGGTPACEDAVLKSLRWFKKNQNADGSWGQKNKAAMTGFALLSYFGHCETPRSAEFGDSCFKGIVYLVNLGVKNDGKMASNLTVNSWPYEHAIAVYALGEATTFCKELKVDIPSLVEVTQKSGQFIIDNQNKNGGWAYLYAKDGGHVDVSVAGWQLQALKACSHTSIKYKGLNTCISDGLDYLNECQNDSGGYGYTGKTGEKPYFTLTGVGMLCNQMWGKAGRSEVNKAAKYVMQNTKFDYNTEFCDLYGHYYESQAMMQRGGDEWKKYNELFRDQLINNQNPDGSWKSPGGSAKSVRAVAASFRSNDQDGQIYRNSLCTLMLEVYYRFLNTDSGGKKNGGI